LTEWCYFPQDKDGAIASKFDRIRHQVVEDLLQPPFIILNEGVVFHNLFEIVLNLDFSALYGQASDLDDF